MIFVPDRCRSLRRKIRRAVGTYRRDEAEALLVDDSLHVGSQNAHGSRFTAGQFRRPVFHALAGLAMNRRKTTAISPSTQPDTTPITGPPTSIMARGDSAALAKP